MQGRGKGLAVTWEGKQGIAFKADQSRTLRCSCCGAPISSEGKVLVTPTDEHFGILEDEPKVIVKEDKLKITGFID